jgi:hypothetical protein
VSSEQPRHRRHRQRDDIPTVTNSIDRLSANPACPTMIPLMCRATSYSSTLRLSTWDMVLRSSTTAKSVAIPIGYANVTDPSLSSCGAEGVSSCAVTGTFPAPWGDATTPIAADILRVTGTVVGRTRAVLTGTGAYLVTTISNFASACDSFGTCSSATTLRRPLYTVLLCTQTDSPSTAVTQASNKT